MIRNVSYHIILTGFLIFQTIQGQNIRDIYVPLPPQELSVEQYLYHIEQVTPFKLAYSTLIVEERRLALRNDSIRLTELLDTLFTKYDVRYIVQGNQLILSPQPPDNKKREVLKLRGVVMSSRTSKAIPYASVYVPYESIGTISNSNGVFELSVSSDHIPDSVFISCIGYKTVEMSSVEFLKGPVDVKLRPYQLQIEELIVRPDDPLLLIRSAIERKAENYPQTPALLTAFFREASMQDEKYISLSEAVIDIYKTSYGTPENDMVRLKKGRRGTNTQQAALVNLTVEGGLYNNIQLDIMKYGVNFLDPEFFSHYEYALDKQISFNDRQTYKISFRYKNDIDVPGFNGVLYLDARSLAVVSAEFSISTESMVHAYSLLIRKVPAGFRLQPKKGTYKVEYRYYDGKWNLSNARSEISLKLRRKRDRKESGFTCLYTTFSEFVITGKTTGDIEKIKYKDASKPGDVLFEQISDTDPEFWGNETVIIPEEPLQETLKKLHIKDETGSQKLVTKPD